MQAARAKTIVVVVISIALVGAFCLVLAQLPNGIGAAIVAGLLAFLGTALAKYYEKQLEIQDRLRQRKVEVYSRFVGFMFDYIKKTNEGETQIDMEKFREFYYEFASGVIMYGSPSVMSAWNAFKLRATNPSAADGLSTIFFMENILRAIRTDLGHEDKQLLFGDISRLFINDFDQAVANASLNSMSAGQPGTANA